MPLSAEFNMSDLARLARTCDPAQKDKLLLALAGLTAYKPISDPMTGEAVAEIMMVLYGRVHDHAKIELSNRLCKIAWASHPLIMTIAMDSPPIAEPVIHSSPVLSDEDMIKIANTCDMEHRILLSRRPEISELVSGVLTQNDEPPVLISLIENNTAKLDIESFATCVRISRRDKSLRNKLTLRKDLPRSLIPSLFAYSDEPMRRMISARFGVNEDQLAHVVKEAILQKSPRATLSSNGKKEDMARKLVDKMAQTERLGGALLVKSLNDKQIVIFDHALARLAGVGVDQWRAAFAHDDLYALALACRAARIDRNVFPTIHGALKNVVDNLTGLKSEAGTKAAKAFTSHSPAAAAVALRLLSRTA